MGFFFSGKLSVGNGQEKRAVCCCCAGYAVVQRNAIRQLREYEWIFLLSVASDACATFNLNVSTYKPNLIILRTACR